MGSSLGASALANWSFGSENKWKENDYDYDNDSDTDKDNDNEYGDDNGNRLFLAYPFTLRNGIKDYASW